MSVEEPFDALSGAFDWVWRTSLEASVLFGLIVLIQRAGGRRLGAHGRYVLSLLVLIRLAMPAVPPSGLSLFNLSTAWTATGDESSPINVSLLSTPELARDLATATVKTIAPGPLVAPQGPDWLNVQLLWAGGWAFGCASLLMLAGCRQRRFKRRVLRQHLPVEPRILALLEEACQTMRVARPVLPIRTRDGTTPALFGWWRPRLLLPDVVLRQLEDRELRLVLLHELAHVRRHDVLLNWVMIIIQALHWFNPLVWLAMRRLRADRELVCDAMVLRRLSDEDRQVYGQTLIKLVAALSRVRLCPSLVPVLHHKHEIKRRVTMIASFRWPSRMAWVLTTAIVLTVCCLTFTRAADPNKPAPATEAQAAASAPPEADAREELERLQMGLRELEDRIRQQQEEVDQLRRELGLPAKVADGESGSAADNETIRHLERERISAASAAAKSQALLRELQKLKSAELSEAIHTAIPDGELSQLMRDLNVAETQYNKMQTELGAETPQVKQLASIIKTVRKQIATRVEGMVKGLSVQIAAHNAQEKSLREIGADISRREAEFARKSRPYFRAKRDLEILERVRETLLQQIVERQYGAGKPAVRQ